MFVEIPTGMVFLSSGILCLFMAFLMEIKGRQHDALFMRLWAMFAICLAIAGFAYFYTKYVGWPITRLVLFLPYSAALSFLWLGARDLRGGSVNLSLAVLPPLLIMLSDAGSRIYEQPAILVVVFHVLLLAMLGMSALEIRRAQTEQGLRSGWELLVLFGLVALLPAWRLYETAIGVDGHLAALAALAATVLGVAVPMAGLHFARERESTRQAVSRHDKLFAWRQQVEQLLNGLPLITSLFRIVPGGQDSPIFRTGDIEAVTGLTSKDFDPSGSLLAHSLEGSEFHRAFHAELLANGRGSVDWRLRAGDGSVRWMQTHCRVIERHDDGSGDVVGYTVDNTAKRSAEAKLVTSARLSSLGEMAVGLAHELRQPLTVIALGAERIRRMTATSGQEEIGVRAAKIVEHTIRASDIIENLRRFAVSEPSERNLVRVPVQDVVKDTLSLIGGALRDATIELVLDLGDPPSAVLGDHVALQQVLYNLFSNARHALMDLPEGRPRRITVSARPAEDGFVRLSVADTAGGIPAAILDRVFEPFLTTKGPDRGTGLGLSIAMGLVTDMGGRISVRNAAAGAVFDIHLRAAA